MIFRLWFRPDSSYDSGSGECWPGMAAIMMPAAAATARTAAAAAAAPRRRVSLSGAGQSVTARGKPESEARAGPGDSSHHGIPVTVHIFEAFLRY